MEAYQQRVVDERRDLYEKLVRLRDFFHTEKFGDIADDEQGRMQRQAEIMEKYVEVLDERLAAW